MVFSGSNGSSTLGNGTSIRAQNSLIANQFDSLTREQSKFEQAATNADNERKQVEETIKKIRTEQKQLSNQLRESQASLGRYDRERSMLVQQKGKYELILKKQRTWIQQCVDEIERLSSTQYKEKQSFCTDMNRLNQELSNILLQQECSRLVNLITGDSSNLLLDHYKQTKVNTSKGNTTPEHNVNNESTQRNKEIVAAAKELQYAEAMIQDLFDTHYKLLHSLDSHRSQILGACTESDQSNKIRTMTDICDMERAWVKDETKSNDNKPYGDSTSVSSIRHLQDFYETGKEDESQNDASTMSID